MKVIRIPTIGFILTTLITTISCSGKPATDTKKVESTAPETITQVSMDNNESSLPTYTVGLDIDYPPYDYQDEFGVSQGFDVDIIQAIAEKENFNVNLIPLNWTNLLAGASSGKYDVIMGGFSDRDDLTDEMRKHYNVSNAYVLGQNTIATMEGKAKIDTFEELKNYKVSTLTETAWINDLIKLKGSSENLTAHDTSFQGFEYLIRGQSDAMLNDKGVISQFISDFPDQKIILSGKGKYFDPYDLVYLANKENPELVQKINTGISDIIKTGEYHDIYRKWFGSDPEILLPSSSVIVN